MVEPKGAELLGRAVAQKAADLPGWIWLPWVPQLMTSLQRPEVAVARRILSAAAGAFPQQLYWYVRPGMLAMKDAAVKAVQDAKAQVGASSALCASSAPRCQPDVQLEQERARGWFCLMGLGGPCWGYAYTRESLFLPWREAHPCSLRSHSAAPTLALSVDTASSLQANARSTAAAAAVQQEGGAPAAPGSQAAATGDTAGKPAAGGEGADQGRPPSPQIEKPIEVCRAGVCVCLGVVGGLVAVVSVVVLLFGWQKAAAVGAH